MSYSPLLSPDVIAQTTANIVVLAGEVATVGIYSSAPSALPLGETFTVKQLTPGVANVIIGLTDLERSVQLLGPGTYQVVRPVLSVPFGVFLDV